MKDEIWIIVWAVLAVVAFILLWRGGQITRLRNYLEQTREELRKCSWPTWDELKGFTLIVTIAIVFLGGFTVGVDQIFFHIFMLFKI
ncbi:MAG TPA: preprotein translocase subunit SecE [Verrucomicrobiae bacterium]|nr:preprotein translocase subunit SecE [Verrucomicrobiae bacterium]